MVGIELSEATQLLSKLIKKIITQKELETITKAKIQIEQLGNLKFIKIYLMFTTPIGNEEIPATITVQAK